MNEGEIMEKDIHLKIYNATIENVLIGFEAEDIDAISISYKKYLKEMYNFSSKNSSNYDKVIEFYINFENKEWSGMTLEGKKSSLLPDSNLNMLAGLSGEAERYARSKIENGSSITLEIAEDLKKRMKDAFDNVASYNHGLAQQYLSEGSVDCDYAAGLTNYSSIRLSHERSSKK